MSRRREKGGPRWPVYGWGLLAFLVVAVVAVYDVPVGSPSLPDSVPAELAPRFEEAHRYIWPEILASWIRPLVGIVAIWLVAASLVAVRIEARYGQDPLRRWPMRILFLAGFWTLINLLGLPDGLRSFLHAREFGLTAMTVPQFFGHSALDFLYSLVVFVLKFLLVFCAMAIFRSRWWLATAVLIFLVFVIIPEEVSLTRPVDPVRAYTDLEAGPYRDAMAEVAARAGEEMDFLVEDRSRRSEVVNMYMTGRMNREYVVVTDTMLETLTPDEVAAVYAHEVGHKVTRPLTVPVNFLYGLVQMLLILYIVHWVHRRQAIPEISRLQALVHIMLTIQVVTQVLYPLPGVITRYREYKADEYALGIIDDPDALRRALLKVGASNLEPYEVPGWVYYTSASHPMLRDRVRMAEEWAAAPSRAGTLIPGPGTPADPAVQTPRTRRSVPTAGAGSGTGS